MTLAEPVSSRIYLLHGFSGLVIQFTYYARTLAMPERLLCPNAYYARTLTMPEFKMFNCDLDLLLADYNPIQMSLANPPMSSAS